MNVTNPITAQKAPAEYEQLKNILVDIYGPAVASLHKDRFIVLIDDTSITPKTHNASEQDVILIAYGDHLQQPDQAPLETLRVFSDAHFQGLINAIHILPHYPSTSDDGFAVSDYQAVDPSLGTWKDIRSLGKDFYLMFDAVFNHTSASHEWFKRFLADDPRYKDYFIALDKDTDVSHVTRPRTHPLLTAFETPSGTKHVWTTFSTDQVDLNYANPDVLYDIIATLIEYIRRGADLIRFDAVAYVWKELGTNSIHHAKAHLIVQFMREVMRLTAPWVWLITETNVPHEENISYFGNGHNEAQMVYNFALPPLVVHTLQTANATTLTAWASTLTTPSDVTHFFNFTASHDGIGVRGVNTILSSAEIDAMCRRVKERGGRLSMKTNPDGSEGVYEMNISFFNAVADPLASATLRIDQFLCSQAIALSLQGVPGIYLHSLLGSENWEAGIMETGHNRSINREKLQVSEVEKELAKPTSQRRQVLDRYAHLLKIRSQEAAFSPLASQEVLNFVPAVFAVRRLSVNEDIAILALHNVTNDNITLELSGESYDLITEKCHQRAILLAPYQVMWLKS